MNRRDARALETAGRFINRVCFSPDGRWIAGGGGLFDRPACILLWRSSSSKPARVVELKRETICALRFSPDGDLLASSCWPDSTVQLWKVPSLKASGALRLIPKGAPPLKSGLKREDTVVGGLAFSADGRLLAAGCWDLRVKIWDLARRSLRELTPPHQDNVDFVAFRDGGRRLISGTADALWVWDAKKGRVLKKIQIRTPEHVWKHALSQDGGVLLSVGNKGTVRVWNLDNWKFESFGLKIKGHIRAIAISPDKTTAAIGVGNGEILFWRIGGREKMARRKLDRGIASLAYSPDGRQLACVQISNGQSRVQVCLLTGRGPAERKRGR